MFSLTKSIEVAGQKTAPAVDPSSRTVAKIKAQLLAHLSQHYRKALDEPIPMLDNHTPRVCAADGKTRAKVIEWLKDLEAHHAKTDQVFDTTWMWEEPNLTDYKS